MLPRVVGICGKMGTGKDIVAEILIENYGYTRIAYADALKKEVEDGIRRKAYPDGMPLHLWEVMLMSTPEQVYEKPTPDGIRELLQFWGSSYRREDDPEYWVRIVENEILRHPDKLWAISDVRFKNEAEAVRNLGGEVWMIERPGVKSNGYKAHISEQLKGIMPDRRIKNSGTVEDLKALIGKLLVDKVAA